MNTEGTGMAGRELDAAVAMACFGLRLEDNFGNLTFLPRYSTDPAACASVKQWLISEKDMLICFYTKATGEWTAISTCAHSAYGTTEEEAIARLAIAVAGAGADSPSTP